MKDLKDILETKEEETLIFEVFEDYIKKCKSYANRPTKGYGSVEEQMKKDAWNEKAENAHNLLCKIMEELI